MGGDNNALALKFQAGARKDVAFDMDVERGPARRDAARHFCLGKGNGVRTKEGSDLLWRLPPFRCLGGNLGPIPQGFGRQRFAGA